jgi:leucyl aminopeptidase (aminopeptidase T)/transposase
MRRAPVIVLSPEERVLLSRWSRSTARSDRRAARARIVLAAAGGLENIEIARSLGVSRLTVARWRDRFLSSRLRGIAHGIRGAPRRPKVSEETIRAIVRRTAASVPGASRPWSTRTLGRQFGVSHTTVHRIWDAYRLRPVRYRDLPSRPDPVAPLLPSEVVGVYLRPPDFAIATLLQPSSAAASTVDRDGSQPPGAGVAHPLAQVLSDLPDPDADPHLLRRRSIALLRFLGGIRREVGPLSEVRVIATDFGRGGTSTLDRWVVRSPNFRIEWVRDITEWRPRALAEVEAAGRRPSLGGDPARRIASNRSLAQSLNAYSAGGSPFVWLATRAELKGGRAAPRLWYELASSGHPTLGTARLVAVPAPSSEDDVRAARAMARVVLRQCLRVRTGERVLIQSWSATQAYANGLVLESLKLGARPLVLYEDESTYWAAAAECRPEYLARIGEHRRAALERADVLVSFFGPSDRARAHALPPNVRARLREHEDAIERAAARAGSRAVQMAIGRLSPASARFYGVDPTAWRTELIEGTLVPPARLMGRAQRIVELLTRGRSVRVTHPNGTDLRLALAHRRPVVSDGMVPRPRSRGEWGMVTLPAGVVQVAVDEGVAEGTFRANVASSAALSGEVGDYAGGRWTFERGRLRRFDFERGGAAFAESYRRAGVGRDRPGSLSFGLNERISIAPLLEDQGLGTVTMHLGRNDHLGGRTRSSWWAWLFLRGADVTIDGERALRAGSLAE